MSKFDVDGGPLRALRARLWRTYGETPTQTRAAMLPNACPKPTESRFSRKQQKRTEEAKTLREVYARVDERDWRVCRVCGRHSNPYAVGLLERGHRHHIVFRSHGGSDSTANLLTLCGFCHDEIHSKGTLRLAGDADLRDPLTNKLNGVRVERLYEEGWRVEKWC